MSYDLDTTSIDRSSTTSRGAVPPAADRLCRVEVRMGAQLVCEHSAEPAEAEAYAVAMGRRFRGLRITVDDEPFDGPRLPRPRLWPLTVK